MRVLVTGAVGYIGSAVCWKLLEHGHDIIALDSLKYGVRESIPPSIPFLNVDIRNQFEFGVDAVIHLAAESEIPLSFKQPRLFYDVNVGGGMNLVELMQAFGCRRFVLSSTSSVYSEAADMPLTEDSPIGPSSPYGASKLAFEQSLKWMPDLDWIAFRYFNVCGATKRVWERPYHRSRIIPVALDVARGMREEMPLNGMDYPTHDGTCVRDYIHVDDVAAAHVLALEKCATSPGIYNLGVGKGYSNRDVIKAAEVVTGKRIKCNHSPRRPGDPPMLVSCPDKAKTILGWQPTYSSLESMIESAWLWER